MSTIDTRYTISPDNVAQVMELTTGELADLADVTWNTSDGYDFLRDVRDRTVNYIQNGYVTYWEDVASEVADHAVPIYNTEIVAVYGDLQAWRHDASDYFPEHPEDALQLMSLTLYSVAHTIASALSARMVEEA